VAEPLRDRVAERREVEGQAPERFRLHSSAVATHVGILSRPEQF
jgi:hypothetical protein